MASTPSIELAPGVFRIPTAGRNLVNSFALLQDDGSVTLVDTGLKRAPARIVAGLAALGKHPRDVTRIVLTHVHPDHAGGAAEMARQTGAPVLAHGDDHGWARAGRIHGATDRSTLLGRLFARTGDARIEAFEPGPALVDGEVLPVSGGLRVVHTPGHSPGHVSLLVEPTGTLITGDALFNFPWMRRARLSPAYLCSDFAMTRRTAHRLGELEYDVAAFTHGPEITERARETVRGILADLPAS
ncbi:MBL fold metallo-hydrolase [Nocardioides panacis]|uniref:MBL fold metallo-hydrolase n=1 Tax=Nocardioides panacis TaxID=2849501 RepID=A0A975T282_9ACTN|nr:MBL fold metallo-hydrolase [Nocardioides panacis]QWZ10318.1 MBL fold metallo-hydrolase [Nocardioides panacis]